MTDHNRDLFNSFGQLFQNRAFMMAMAQQFHFGDRGNERGGRGQMGILRVLADAPAGLTNAEIAEILDIRPSSVSATLSRLEDAELITREPSPRDKRVVIIKLSTRGQEMAAHRVQGTNDLADQLFGNLTDEECEQLQHLLAKLRANADGIDIRKLMHFGQQHGFGPHPGWGRGPRWFN